MAARAKGEASPMEQLAALERTLEAGELPRAFLVRGEERWFRDRALEKIVEAARAKQFELVRYDGQDPDVRVGALCDALGAPPMFSGPRVIVVRNASALIEKKGGQDSPFQRAAIAFLKDGKVPGILVLDTESLRADSVLAKSVVAAGGPVLSLRRLWETPPPWDPDPRKAELVAWLAARARERKLALKPEEVLYVSAAVGNDLYALDAALDRVEQRGAQGVREVVGWTSAASPFQVAEDMLRGDGPKAIAGIEALFRGGFQEKDGSRETDRGALLPVLFGSLRSKLRPTLTGALVLERGGDVAAAADAAGINAQPRARTEFEARVRSRAARDWRGMLGELAELERKSRSGANVDVNDVAALALRWAKASAARPPAPAAARPAIGAPGARGPGPGGPGPGARR
ncbi:MAG: hypothetical protein IPJ77_19740 [Planctomycetes bacterium]|nr:hypothetical protein [Planctomycetota bacterium]